MVYTSVKKESTYSLSGPGGYSANRIIEDKLNIYFGHELVFEADDHSQADLLVNVAAFNESDHVGYEFVMSAFDGAESDGPQIHLGGNYLMHSVGDLDADGLDDLALGVPTFGSSSSYFMDDASGALAIVFGKDLIEMYESGCRLD